MAKKRKDGCPDPSIFVDRNEIMKLTKVAKSWEFTCSFCFKKFPSAQAMGGHQNAHRTERMEEKKLFVRDPIGYRKRAYLRAMKAAHQSSSFEGGLNNILLHEVVKHDDQFAPPKMIIQKPLVLPGTDDDDYFCQPWKNIVKDSPKKPLNMKKTTSVVVINFLPPKELSLAESVGVYNAAEDAKGKGYGINLDQNLDLTLKL